MGPQRGLWSTTAGGEFPRYFCDVWKRLVCSKQWFPKALTELYAKFDWKSVTASSSALPHRCWLAWLSLLPEQSHNVPCPPVGNHEFLLGLCQNPNCHRVWKPDISSVARCLGDSQNPDQAGFPSYLEEALEAWISLRLIWGCKVPHSFVVPRGIRTPSSWQHQ